MRLKRGGGPALAVTALCLLGPPGTEAGVKYGDAVPGVIYPLDIERVKRVLHLDRFSIIAAVRLGAEEGREAIVAEPLSDEALRQVTEACEAGGFCPDPLGYVASRVLIVRLVAGEVEPLVVIQDEARGPRGRLADLRRLGMTGSLVGWNGRADGFEGHIALSLTPVTRGEAGRIGVGLDPPLLIRFNHATDRFQVYECVQGGDGRSACDFLDEPGD